MPPTIGGAGIIITDVEASNGYVHVIDAVILPPAEEPADFCATYATICGEWTAETPCAEWWAAAVAGEEGATEGASQACYTYHLEVAATMEEGPMRDAHCAHSVGGTDAEGNAPCTD